MRRPWDLQHAQRQLFQGLFRKQLDWKSGESILDCDRPTSWPPFLPILNVLFKRGKHPIHSVIKYGQVKPFRPTFFGFINGLVERTEPWCQESEMLQ